MGVQGMQGQIGGSGDMEEIVRHDSMSDFIFWASLNRASLFRVTVDGVHGFAFNDMRGRLHYRLSAITVSCR